MKVDVLNKEAEHFKCDVIDQKTINTFRNVFGDINSYTSHMFVLWSLRDLIINNVGGEQYIKQSNMFPAFKTINEIIGVLGVSQKGFSEFIKLYGV